MLPALPGVLTAAFLASRVAATVAAAPACDLVLEASHLEAPWRDAVQALRAWLRGGQDIDCGRIDLRAEGSGARVTFATSDGRLAERYAATPSDLLAVVQALASTIPDDVAAGSESPEAETTLASASPGKGVAAGEQTSGVARLPGVLFDARTGVRMPGPVPCSSSAPSTTCTFAALSIGVGVGVHVGPWELGVALAFEPTYATLSGAAPATLSMTSYSAGLSAGRHAHAGDVDFVLGAEAGVRLTSAFNETDDETPKGHDQDSFSQVEPRVGLFAGVVVPSHAALRFRPQLGFDVIPSHLGRSWTNPDAPLPGLAWWTASASVGVQWLAP